MWLNGNSYAILQKTSSSNLRSINITFFCWKLPLPLSPWEKRCQGADSLRPRAQQSQALSWTLALHLPSVAAGSQRSQLGAVRAHIHIYKCQFSTRDICSGAATRKPSPLREANTHHKDEMLISKKGKLNGRYLPKSEQMQITYNFSCPFQSQEVHQWHQPQPLSQEQTMESQSIGLLLSPCLTSNPSSWMVSWTPPLLLQGNIQV